MGSPNEPDITRRRTKKDIGYFRPSDILKQVSDSISQDSRYSFWQANFELGTVMISINIDQFPDVEYGDMTKT